MFGRFLQLFLLAAVVLLLPSLFYLSRQHQEYSLAKDYSFMQTHSYQEHQQAQQQQGSQGKGEPPAIPPQVAQSWKFINPLHGFGLGGGGSSSSSGGDKFDAGKAEAGSVVASGGGDGGDGGAIMPKMDNATAKAELGRATWRFLHTMTLRFPERPTEADRETLLRFFHDFSRLYPCGECASHFQQLLEELPPQTSSRKASALWLCTAHNKVNKRLGKPEFPCDKLDETYDCGCGDEKTKDTPSSTSAAVHSTSR